jgi:cytochrome P450
MSLPQLEHDPREHRGHGTSPPALEWVPSLGCWCVFDTGTINTILRSTDFAAADFVELHRELERKVGIDCSTLIGVLQHTPTANEGKRHAETRKELAQTINRQMASTKELTAKVTREQVAKVCIAGARIDLMSELVQPVCDAIFAGLLGVACPKHDNGASGSQIFDFYLGLRKRRELNANATELMQYLCARQENLSTTPEYAIALSNLGHDSIVGSLGCSLLHVLDAGGGQRLCDLSFPAALPATGVPYIERFAVKDRVIGDVEVRDGDRLRLYLDARTSGEERPYFGKGRHSCLGEELSKWMWRTLTGELAKVPLGYTLESATRRKPDWVFTFYSSIMVRFHA